ncbi:MAG: RNA methyltransferase [Pirellulaceae bacterium]|nr:RNA methyltransferase [Pirellulaceae bacterium]
MMIHSPHNPRIKQAVRLRDRRGRQQQRRIIVDGQREIERALDGGVRPVEAFFRADDADLPAAAALRQRLLERGADCWEVAGPVFQKVCYGERAEGVVLVAATPGCSLADFQPRQTTLIAVLEGIEKPGNVGAVLRSADAAGVDGVILADAAADPFNPNTIRASLGTVFSVPLCVTGSDQALDWLRQRGLQILVARVDGDLPYFAADLTVPTALVLGGEATGASQRWCDSSITGVVLPMRGRADSLNVSVTAAILFYEALRQRTR